MADAPASSERYRLNRLNAEFADSAVEHAYRVAAFADWRGLNRLAFMITAVSIFLHTVIAQALFGFSALYFQLLAIRGGVFLALLLIFPLTARPERFGRTDAGIFSLQLLIIAAFFAFVMLMPADQRMDRITVPSVMALLLLLAQYLFVANRLRYALAAGLACTAAYFLLNLLTGRLALPALAIEGVIHLIANVLGFTVAYRSATLRRRQYALLSKQEDLNRQLEAKEQRLTETAAEIARARDDALRANRAKSEFLAYMSHELRSPMNAIIGFSEIMKREVFGRIAPAKYRDYAEDIHGSATHLLSLINDILDLSKAEAGKLVIRDEQVDLAALAESVRRLVALRAEAAGVALQTRIAAGLPPLVADARMVKQIMLNLLSNAIKFTPAGGAVTHRGDRAAAGALFVAVTDTGCGIPAHEIPRILEPYGRTKSADLSAAEGTGLGLALVKAMAEAHGAKLEIESEVKAGSTFTLRFPPARTELAAAA